MDRYYGVHGAEVHRQDHQIGAGHDPTEEEDLDVVADYIAMHQAQHVRHDPVGVPNSICPFINEYWHGAFEELFQHVRDSAIIPEGLGMREEEWEGDHYPLYEEIRCGQRGSKPLLIPLPVWLWRPRAEVWVQALDVLVRVKEAQAEANE